MDNLIWTAQTGPDLNLNEFCQSKIRKVQSKSDLPSPDLRLKFWVKSWQGIQSLYQNYFFKKIYALNLILIFVSRIDLTWLNTRGKYRHGTWDWTRFSRLYFTMSAPVKIFHHENGARNTLMTIVDYFYMIMVIFRICNFQLGNCKWACWTRFIPAVKCFNLEN